MAVPLVVALPLAEALAALEAAGCACREIVHTAAPRDRGRQGGELFVVRQQPVGEREVRLTVARHPGRPEV